VQAESGLPLSTWLIAALLGVFTWQTIHYYPLVPQTVASHFGPSGRPNGFQSRTAFFVLMWVIQLLMVLAFIALPRYIGRVNPRLLNIPNREFWLLADQVERMKQIVYREMSLCGVGVIAFMVFVMQMVLEANVARARLNNAVFLGGLAAFLAFILIWMIRLYRKLAVPADAQR
jgi:uncharacterized membrane protein